MKKFIKIQKSQWVQGSNNKMIYEDEEGRLFLGPPIEYICGETIIVETSEGPLKDGYYHIIKVVGRF